MWLNLINSGDAVIAKDSQGKRLTIMQTLWTAMQMPSQINFKIIFDIYARSHSIMCLGGYSAAYHALVWQIKNGP